MPKTDSWKLGLVLGFLSPIAGLLIYYLMRLRIFSLKEFFQLVMMQKSLMSAIVSIALITNVIVFTLFVNKHKDKTAKGIFVASCIYALTGLCIKWFG